jgi:hypothetical protein
MSSFYCSYFKKTIKDDIIRYVVLMLSFSLCIVLYIYFDLFNIDISFIDNYINDIYKFINDIVIGNYKNLINNKNKVFNLQLSYHLDVYKRNKKNIESMYIIVFNKSIERFKFLVIHNDKFNRELISYESYKTIKDKIDNVVNNIDSFILDSINKFDTRDNYMNDFHNIKVYHDVLWVLHIHKISTLKNPILFDATYKHDNINYTIILYFYSLV